MNPAYTREMEHAGRDLSELVGLLWREIESAPEDEEILIAMWDETGAYITNDRYSSEYGRWVDWPVDISNKPPTHWMPLLPAPPQSNRGTTELTMLELATAIGLASTVHRALLAAAKVRECGA